MRFAILLACAALAGCGPYPRDISGTLDAIEREHRLRVGLAELAPGDAGVARRFTDRIAAVTGARAELITGPTEALIAGLEDGDLDLVIGEFRDDSPWLAKVTVIEPLRHHALAGRVYGLSPAAANGENRWIALLEREVREAPMDAVR